MESFESLAAGVGFVLDDVDVHVALRRAWPMMRPVKPRTMRT